MYAKSMQEPPEKQLRVLVSTVNTVVGQAVVENLRNDNYNDDNPHIIIGTVDKEDLTPACRGVKRIILGEDSKTLMRVVLDCDVIIYDALKAPIDEIQFVLKTLTSFNYAEPKTFILISSVLAWSDTPPKEFIDENTGEAIEVTSIKTGKTGRTFGTNATDNSLEGKDPLKSHYTDKEYNFRRALPAYEYLRTIENATLAAGKNKPALKTYVICSGIVYGNGEDPLYDIIETAFQGEQPLVVIGDGKNKIPMIHAVDLSTIVKKVVHEPPSDLEYINAIDFAPNRSQSKLINAISEAMGGLEIQQLTHLDAVFQEDYNLLTLNVNLIPTDIMGQVEQSRTPDDERQTFAEGERKMYRWKYRSGLVENFDEIYKEFKVFRNLKTIKLAIYGLGSTHESLYGEELSRILRIPFISYEKLVSEVQMRDDTIGKSVKEYLETEKNRLVREATEELEKLKAKKKKGIPDSINPDDYIPRLNLNMINKIFSWRLNRSDCKNKGYILEGYPTTRMEASELFIEKIPVKNEIVDLDLDQDDKVSPTAGATVSKPAQPDPAVPEQLRYEIRLRSEIVPDKVVYIQADSGADLFAHLKTVLGDDRVTQELKITPEVIDQKVQEWNQKLTPEQNSISDFYKEHHIEIFTINVKSFDSKQKVFDFISEKIGFALQDAGLDIEASEVDMAASKMVGDPKTYGDAKGSINLTTTDNRRHDQYDSPKPRQEEQLNMSLEEIKQQEQEILNQKSQALKQYITDNLLPGLTAGLIDICDAKPEDPLDYLADFLIALSQKKSTAAHNNSSMNN